MRFRSSSAIHSQIDRNDGKVPRPPPTITPLRRKSRRESNQPQLFHLPDDLTKANDLLAQHPDRARELLAKWSEWNKEYVLGRLMGHTDYHKQRDAFFSEAVPKPATASGYAPKVKATFR